MERSGLGSGLVSNTAPFPMFPQDARLSAKVALRGKALRVQLDLRKYAAAWKSRASARLPERVFRIIAPAQQNWGAKIQSYQ